MTPAELLNSILDEAETRICTVLDIDAEQVYESRQTGEASGTAVYIEAAINEIVPHTQCAELATVTVTVGFHVPIEDSDRARIQRVTTTMAIRDVLVWKKNGTVAAISGVLLPKVTDMAVSGFGDPDEGFLMGGLTWQFQVVLDKAS